MPSASRARASIIYLQILTAVSFFFVWLICWVIMVAMSRS
jgi:hypothetical protein